MDGDLTRIEKLQDEEQWLSWKFQVKVILRAADLYDMVDGSSPLPVKKATQEEADYQTILQSWKQKDSKAQKIIVTTIGKQPMLHIMNCSNACEMWKKLESVYEQKTKTNIHLLQQRFYSYTKEPDDNMSVYISKLETIVQQLKDLGESISEYMIVTKILMTLPPNYNHFYSAWESTDETQQTLKNLTSRLLMEESRLLQQNSNGMPEVFVAKKASKNHIAQNRERQRRPGRCFICKQEGHWKASCPSRLPKQRYKSSDKVPKREGARGEAFVSECQGSACDISNDWFLDSGASDHMTSKFEWFTNFKKFETPMPVRIGNGKTIFAYGSGDINILSFDNEKWNEKYLSNVLYVPEIKLNLFSSSCALDKGR